MKLCVLWSVLLSVNILGLVSDVYAFNLETRLPIVKRGAAGSYFGYSVAEHQSINEIDESITHEWLLVGAPLDQNLQPGTNRSGALWRCPVSTKSDDCEQVITDGKKIVDSSELMGPTADEIKDGQWMGVTVRSQGPGKKVMVCAHRYVLKGPDYRWGQGLCYTLTQFLDYDQNWEPCKARPTNKAHEQYGFCQAGTSGMLLEDDTMLIGTPGPYTWRGTLYVIDIQDDYIARDQTKYFGPVEEKTSPVDKYSYLGMSVTGGYFLDDKMSYAAGAPRSNNSGQVVIFTKMGLYENIMRANLTINGEQFGSSFGYEMTTADVNGDGRSDLIVGAPFFFNKEEGGAVYVYVNDKNWCLTCNDPIKLTGKPESRFGFALSNLGDLNKDGYDDIAVGAPYEEAGVVYIYLGSHKGLINVPAQTIRASELPRSQYPYNLQTFGYSLSGGVDLDHNGYPDLLVGAYDSAAVVLLRSRPIIEITTKIQPEKNLRGIDPNRPGCARDANSQYTCFSFDACCTIKTVVKNRVNSLTLIYEIEAETFERKFSRVWFGPNSETKPYTMKRQIVLRPDATRGELHHCQLETVYIKDNTRDIQSPIKFRLSYALDQQQPREAKQGQPLPYVDDFPILNQQEAAKTFHATFLTDCGDNDICESDVRVAAHLSLPRTTDGPQHEWQLVLGEGQDVLLKISVTNKGESAYEAQLFVSHPPSLAYVSQDKSQSKQLICTPFNKTLVACTLGNPFKRGVDADFTLRFDPKGIRDAEPKLDIVVFANSTSQEVLKRQPTMLRAHVVRRAEISLKGTVQPDHVFYGGEVKGESAMKHTSDIGSRVLHAYRVINDGPWKVSSLNVHIEWPFQVANDKPRGKWLLYLEDLPTVDSEGGECWFESGEANPLKLPSQPELFELPLSPLTQPSSAPIVHATNFSDSETHFRRRRDTVVTPTLQKKDGKWEQVVEISCSRGTAICLKIVCSIENLRPKQEAIINIRARLWNSTLVEDYPKVDRVEVRSKGKIHLPPGFHIEQTSTADDEHELATIAYPDLLHQQESEPVPIWIIIVAIVAGLLLLILLTLVLWKLGFFKRRRPDPTLSGNLEKSHREDDS